MEVEIEKGGSRSSFAGVERGESSKGDNCLGMGGFEFVERRGLRTADKELCGVDSMFNP